ncbi:MAG: protein kinase [Sorangiineae bacterium]|nr:protein kinase [Polyangiaceae bacterium]MEB2323397.1 protein kinase [Sorangiineae bacterium]
MTLASRFRVDERLADGARPRFLGTDLETERRVVLFELTAAEAEPLRPIVGLEHAHVATLLGLVDGGDERMVLVAEHVPGRTLAELLRERGRRSPVAAVRAALRVADALSHLHESGGVHGGVSSGSVVVEPDGDTRPAPVLGYAPPAEPPSPFRSPERGPSDPPSVADDAWAVGATFFEMLTGEVPPAGGVASEASLASLEITDATLRQVLRHTLDANPAERAPDLHAIKRELARWFVEHASDETATPTTHVSSMPPPLPPGVASLAPAPPSVATPAVSLPPATSMPPAPPPSKRRMLPLFAVGAIVCGLGAAWAFSALAGRPTVIEVPVASSAPGPASAAPPASARTEIDLSEVPVTGETASLTGDKMATCVAGYLPKGAFKDAPEMDWLCGTVDPRDGAAKLRTAIVQGSAGGVSDAMKLMSRLGWYDMAAFAVARSGCCTDAKPLELPAPTQGCGRADAALDTLGHALAGSRPYEPALDAFTSAIECEAKAGRASLFRRNAPPASSERSAFIELIHALQAP